VGIRKQWKENENKFDPALTRPIGEAQRILLVLDHALPCVWCVNRKNNKSQCVVLDETPVNVVTTTSDNQPWQNPTLHLNVPKRYY